MSADGKNTLLIPTAYLPPLEYMVAMLAHSKAEVDLHETYPKQTWRNRCRILTANGVLDLTIPVTRPMGNHTRTLAVMTSSHEPWQQKHWRAISSAYRKAPYFIFYEDLIAPYYLNSSQWFLWEFNHQLLHAIAGELNMDLDWAYTDTYKKQALDYIDLRNRISPKNRDDEPLIDHWPIYYQTFSEKYGFIPNLSIIDLLFHMGPDAPAYLRDAIRFYLG
ncbi:MAG: hypothetical protein EA394_03075 [Bacteroidia bacterium]|nr:MAG: hypothetical protein EA394_03075 [Bacteroidia bacterium]